MPHPARSIYSYATKSGTICLWISALKRHINHPFMTKKPAIDTIRHFGNSPHLALPVSGKLLGASNSTL